jgi:flagellin
VATAVRIIDNALDKVLSAEASLGSFQKYTLEASANVAASTQENVASALNDIAGTDVATETALLANNQLLQQATVQSLLMFNQQRQSLLTLLTSLAASV